MTKKQKPAPTAKRAAIYVRVSSERQAEGVSPQAQEADCRAYCEEHGYRIVEVYRDIEKYRVGRSMVEPSGTRADRPQLKRMLADATMGAFDVIVSWREDRLYRGIRPMIDVIDCIEAHGLDIKLVKETFDRKMAPIKASIAKMELDAKGDRTAMGIMGRLAKGKVWRSGVSYGYRKNGDAIELDPEESKWARQIWEWYAAGVGAREIRRRLIAGGVPQKCRKADETRGVAWELCSIYAILRHQHYYTGIQTVRWDGQTFEIHVPIIVDPATAQRVAERRERQKNHPAHNVKHDYLGMGLVYCKVCDRKMSVQTIAKHSDGRLRNTPFGHYRCARNLLGYGGAPKCPKKIGSKKLDVMLWEKVYAFVSDDERFERELHTTIEALRAQEADASAGVERLQRQIDDLAMERQRTITKWRKGGMTDEDYDLQYGEMAIEETELKQALAEKSLLIGNKAQKLIDFANRYRLEIRAGLAGLKSGPLSPEDAKRQFEIKRACVENLITRVDLKPDKTIEVHFVLNLSGMVEDQDTPAPWPPPRH